MEETLQSTASTKETGLATYALVPGHTIQAPFQWIQITMNEKAMMTIVDTTEAQTLFEKTYTPEKEQVACWMRQEELAYTNPSHEVGKWSRTRKQEDHTWNISDPKAYVSGHYLLCLLYTSPSPRDS